MTPPILPIDIATLIPHQGAMCLNERLVAWDAQHVVLETTTHRALDNPLRRRGRLRAVHLCEYGAQAMAVHGGLLARDEGRNAQPGLLVSLRGVAFHCAYVDDLAGMLTVEAEKLLDGGGSWQYAFRVKHGERLLAEGRAAVMMLPT
jgi:predicted hotdog family 3-hydroxylacyl-ACP dehydratase